MNRDCSAIIPGNTHCTGLLDLESAYTMATMLLLTCFSYLASLYTFLVSQIQSYGNMFRLEEIKTWNSIVKRGSFHMSLTGVEFGPGD